MTEKQIYFKEKYIISDSINRVQQWFSLLFNREAPCKRNIQCNTAKYLNFVTSPNRNKGNFGRSRSPVRDENIEGVQELLENNPHASAWVWLGLMG